MDGERAVAVHGEEGAGGAVGMARLAERLAGAERALDDLLEHTSDLAFLAAADGTLRAVNRAWRQALGLAPDAAPVERFVESASREAFREAYRRTLAEGAATLATTFRAWDGTPVEAVGRLVRHERAPGLSICGLFRDLSARRFQEGRQSHLATRDPLTSLANRALFAQHVPLALARARRQGTLVGVVLVDLDAFRTINAIHGHAGGDQILVAIADRLRRSVRTEDLAARLEADRFAIVLERLHTPADAAFVVERTLATAMTPLLTPAGEWVRPGASIGVAVGDGTTGDGDALLRAAEGALRAAKRAGGERFALAEAPRGDEEPAAPARAQ